MPIEEDLDKEVGIRRSNITDIRVSHKDIAKYGVSPGCEACECITDNKKVPIGLSHSAECRKRIRANIQADEDTHERVARADRRKAKNEPDRVQAYIGRTAGVKSDAPRHIGRLEKEIRTQMMKLMAGDIEKYV